MPSVERCDLPEESLLAVYRNDGAYTDCYATEIDRRISQIEYVQAFYTTTLFKVERKILQWAVSRPSTDEEACLLAEARAEKFAAWYVEARRDDQILLSDYRRRTRSWLMSEPSASKDGHTTRLYFGSAVVPIRNKETGEMRMGSAFSLLLTFHRLYAQALLLSAKLRLQRLS
jgi:hypothetical protein